MSADLIMGLLVKHLCEQETVTDLVGRAPVKIFPGTVPAVVEGRDIKPPWINLRRGPWDEEKSFSGRSGCYTCPSEIVVIADTITQASEIYQAVYDVLDSKYSVTWSERLWVGESLLTLGQQVDLLEPDGSPSAWQQVIGNLSLLCEVLPLAD